MCDVLKIDGSLARNIDFEVANFQVLRKTRRKTSILKLQSVKSGGSLARNARFGALTCLVSRHWFYGGFAVSMEEAARHVLFAWFPTVEIGGCLARKACLGAPTCLVSSLRFPGGFAMSMGEAAKRLLFEGFQAGCHGRFAWQAWHFVTFQPVG